MIKVLFFAQLRERLNCSEVELEVDDGSTLDSVRLVLSKKGPEWEEALGAGKLLMAVNQTMLDGSAVVKDGDEVAFFPPVTGG